MRHSYLLLVLCLPIALVAQDAPRVEVLAGSPIYIVDTGGVSGSTLDSLCNSMVGVGTCPSGTFQVHNGFFGWNGAVQVRGAWSASTTSSKTRLMGLRPNGTEET
jgi:hypothetical protein